MKLSKTQQEVLDLMANGWELGESLGLNPSYWLQRGGIGKGGEGKDVRSTTVFRLLDLKLIKVKERRFPTAYYELEGKQC